MIELFLALIVGILAGIFTGLAPAVHINLIASILVSYVSFVSPYFSLLALVVFIVSMSVTHTFIDFIPSIFLGAPQEDNFLAILPGHQMFMEGKGFSAVVYTLKGALFGIGILLVFTPIFILFLPSIYSFVSKFIPFLLIFISFYIIFRDKEVVWSLIIFTMAAFLGIFSFNLPVKDPLLPLLTGLFGLSSIIISLKDKVQMSSQQIESVRNITLTRKEFVRSSLAAVIFSPLCSFLPGIGSSHATTLASEIIQLDRKGFLFLSGAINTAIMSLSFIAVYVIGRARSGSAAAVKTILQNITFYDIIVIASSILISGILAYYLGIIIARVSVKFIEKVNYHRISICVIIILLLVNIIFTNLLGIIVLLTATAIGIFCILSGIKRINLMASLIVPAIIFYLTN